METGATYTQTRLILWTTTWQLETALHTPNNSDINCIVQSFLSVAVLALGTTKSRRSLRQESELCEQAMEIVRCEHREHPTSTASRDVLV